MADIVMDDFRSIETQLHEVVPQSAVAAASVNTDEIHDVTKRVQMPTQTEREVLQNMWTQTEKQKRQKKYKAKLDIASQIKGNIVDDIIVTNTVCPPPLFFNHDLEPKHKGHLDLINNLLQQGESCTPADDSDSSEEDTIRLEDISDSELEYKRTAYDSFKQRKSQEKPFIPPSTVTSLTGKQLKLKDFPLLNAIMTEISAIANQTEKKERHATIKISKPRRASSASPKRKSDSRSKSKSPHRGRTQVRERESIENFVKRMHSPKASLRELPIIKPTYDTSHQPTPRKPTHSNKCDHGQVAVPKAKSWLRKTPVPMEVKKTKLSFGLTNTQRLRLEKSNPELLKSMEKREAERVQRFKEQRRLEEEAKMRGFGATKKLYDGTEQRGAILFGKSQSSHHKKPVPTPRQSLHSPQHSFVEQEHPMTTIQQVHEEYRNQYNATPDIDVFAESQYTKGTSDPIGNGDKNQLRYVARPDKPLDDSGTVQNDPGFPVSETSNALHDQVSYDDDFEEATERTASRVPSSVRDVPKRSYYGYPDDKQPSDAPPEADDIQVKALEPMEVLGLRQMNERYSDDSESFKSALSHSDHVEVKPYPVSSDSPTEPRKSGSAPAMSRYNAQRGTQQAINQPQYPGVDASVESTAYISRSQAFANQSQESDVSANQQPPSSSESKRSKPRPVMRRRNTDSISSYVGEDEVSPKSKNYSDESFDDSSNEGNLGEYAVPDPLSMKDLQISKEAKLGYTWA